MNRKGSERNKIRSVDELRTLRSDLKREDKVVVQCHGCFDIVHPGHIQYLRFAREQGDVLFVSVSGDDVVGKGFDRPYINEDLRLENLAALEFVDYVCLDHNAWAGPVLETLRPDIYVKGKEYETNSDPRFKKEKQLVEGYGGKVIYSSGDVVYSSTLILNRFSERFSLEQQKIAFFCRQHGIDRARIDALVSGFAERRVLVVGDPIFDHYVHCEALGVAAESPILSVTPIKDVWCIGAGGLIAKQFAALGAKAGFLTTTSDASAHAARFRAELSGPSIEVFEVRADNRPTYVKERFLVDEQKIFKVDHGRHAPLSTSATREVIRVLDEQMEKFDALVVTDFGYGFFGNELVEAVPALAARHGKPYYVDVSHTGQANILKFKRPRLATPTEHEIRFAFADSESGFSHLARRYYDETSAEQLVMTLGKRGLILFHRSEEPKGRLRTDYLPAFSVHAQDPVGAGDVLLAGLVLADVSGASLQVGAYFGNCLAALHVQTLGNEPVRLADAEEYLNLREELRG